MDSCRICLQHKRNLCSVFEGDNGISFADMLTSVANVKIVEGYKNSICLQCRRKLRTCYNFKKEIERSDLELSQQQNLFKYNNFIDIKSQLLQEAKDDKMNIRSVSKTDYTFLLENEYESVSYKDITITKKCFHDKMSDIKLNTEILSNLDVKSDYESDYEPMDLHDDWEYTPVNMKKSARKPKRAKGKDSMMNKKFSKKVCIKPIILDYLRVIPSQKPRETKENKRKVRRYYKQGICPHCGKLFSDLNTHILVHTGEKKHICPECNKGYYTLHLLRYHQIKHASPGAFKCNQCVAVFNYKQALKSHMNTHINIRAYICPTCNKGFKKKSHLQRHQLIHNSSAKSFKCNLCNMTFFYNHGLKHHMRIHTGERPYKCELCSQPYSYKHDFNRHCLKKHGVFLKRRRDVYVMNEEVLKKERALMQDLVLRVEGVIKDGEPINPIKGPSANLAFKAAVEALRSNQIPLNSVF